MTPEQELTVATVRRFVREEILPLESELDPDADHVEGADLDRLRRLTRQMGLYSYDVPGDLGGPGIDLVTQCLMTIEMSQHRAGLYAPCYGAFGAAGLAQLYEATPDQRERYLEPVLRGEKKAFFALTEPSGGSDPARAIQMRAVQSGDEWILNGTKLYISGADGADFGLVFARTGESTETRSITCFIVESDTPGFEISRVIHTLRNAKYACQLEFRDVRVPAQNVLGEVHGGFQLATKRLLRQRIPYSAGCVGVAIAAQQMAIEWAKSRETFGALLATRQAVQWMIVDNEIDIRQARSSVLEAAAMADSGQPFRVEAAIAKLVATEAAGRVVDRAMQIHGGAGMTKDLPLERWYRELRIRRVGEGPSEIQRMIVARELLGTR